MVQTTNYEITTDIESSSLPSVAALEVGTPTIGTHAVNLDYLAGIGAGIKNKLDATTGPAITDDSGDGYSVGSLWCDVTANEIYQAIDVTVGAAIWNLIINNKTAQSIGGIKTFTDTTQSTTKDDGCAIFEGGVGIEKNLNVGGNAVITGDLTVNGTTTTLNTSVLDVEDAQINVNKGGTQTSADDVAGINVEMSDATHVKMIYDKDLASKWKAGVTGSEKELMTVSDTQTVTNKKQDDALYVKQISDPAAGDAGYNKLYPKADGNWYNILPNGTIKKLGGGGGGSALIFRNDDTPAAGEETSFGQLAYTFSPGDTQKLYTSVKVPNEYTAGQQIKLKIKTYSPTGSGNILLQSVATLIRSGTDDLSSTTNQRTSINSAQTVSVANREYVVDLDLTDTSGQINSVAVSANDTILIYLQRGTDTNADLAYFMPSSSELIIA